MPLEPVLQTLQLPVETPDDVAALFDAGLALVHHPSASYRDNAIRDLEDHFFYLGAAHPGHTAQLQPELARLTDEQLNIFSFAFSTWLYLLYGADDSCVDTLTQALNQNPKNWVRQHMLAAIGTPSALTNLAALAHDNNLISEFENLGFEIPTRGQPAQPRFMLRRRAIRTTPFRGDRKKLTHQSHPIDLPLASAVNDPTSGGISWHYLSLDLTALDGLPPMDTNRLHLVGPPIDSGWTLYCDILSDGKYKVRSVERDEHSGDELDDLWEEDHNDDSADLAYAELLPYDDNLTYCNGHTLQTNGVVGDVGGSPIGLYPNPKCLECGHLMFHVFTVQSQIRSYGDGWRSLLICENCQRAACNATSWN